MERNDFLNILYSERQRLSEKNKNIGWSIWILVGTLATLLWMLINTYMTYITQINSQEIYLLSRDLCTILFSILLFRDYNEEINHKFYPDRFIKSSMPFIKIVDFLVSFILFISYLHYNSGTLYNITTFIISFYFILKSIAIFHEIKWKQRLILLFTNIIYLIFGITLVVRGIIQVIRIISFTKNSMISIEFSLLISGTIAIMYILLITIYNPLRKITNSIDRLIDKALIDENLNIDLTYEELISIKIGCKYSQLYQKYIEFMYSLIRKQKSELNYIKSIEVKINSPTPLSKKELNIFIGEIKEYMRYHKLIIYFAVKINKKCKKSIHHISFNDNEEELYKLSSILNKIIDNAQNDIDILNDISKKVRQYIGKIDSIPQ